VLSRRRFFTGLIAAPLVMRASSLMPLRGIKLDPIVRIQSWPLGEEAFGAYWVHEGPLSKIGRIETVMREVHGAAYYSGAVNPEPWQRGPARPLEHGNFIMGTLDYDHLDGSRIGFRETREEYEEHHRQAMEWDIKAAPSRVKGPTVWNMTADEYYDSTDRMIATLESTMRGDCKYDLCDIDGIVFKDDGAHRSEPQVT
jgi:hypothetical protein